jgi:hypothetical protein
MAGETIPLRAAESILGGRKPLLVALTSSCADAFGVPTPMPTCALVIVTTNSRAKKYDNFKDFIIIFLRK